jgi:hypothetical protein
MEGRRKDSPNFPHFHSTFLRTARWQLLQPLCPPALPRNSWHWSQSILPRIREFWTCNAQCRCMGVSASPMMARLLLMLSKTRALKTSGSSRSMVRRESRSATSSRNKSKTFAGLSMAANWDCFAGTPIPMLYCCKSPNRRTCIAGAWFFRSIFSIHRETGGTPALPYALL